MQGRARKSNRRVGGGGPSSAGDLLAAFFRETGLDVVCREWDAVKNWGRVVGDGVARVTECEKVEDGVLYVKVASAPWRQELSYMKNDIKESIIRETGCDSIRDIVFY